MDNFSDIYDSFLLKIENYLDKNIPESAPDAIYKPFRYIIAAGGKRIRPVITLISTGSVGGNPQEAIAAASAIEILHNFTLLHDDIMDRSAVRRGKPTVHIKWDEPTAILSGDAMVGYAYKFLEYYRSHPNFNKIFSVFNRGLIEVCEGQAFDMDYNNKTGITVSDYLTMIRKKTAHIIETSALLGAYVGNGSENQVTALSDFALNLGLAFQLQDDLLDLTAVQAELGKTIGQDITEGKKTYLIIRLREKALNEDKTLIEKFYSENGLSIEYVPQIRELMGKYGIIRESRNLADSYFVKAERQLPKLPKNQYTEMLDWLINKLNKRKY